MIKVFFRPASIILYRNKPPFFFLVASIDFHHHHPRPPQRTLTVLMEAEQLEFTLKVNVMNKKQYGIIL